MFFEWNNMEMLELMRDRGEPLILQLEQAGKGRILITANQGRQAEIPTADLGKTRRQLETMLVNYPHEAVINGEAVRREPAPDRARVARTDYGEDSCRSYSFRSLEITHGVPADGRTQELLIGGVRMSASGPRPGRISFYAPVEEGGTTHWKPAAQFKADTILSVPDHLISDLQTDSRGRLEIPRDGRLHQHLQEQAGASLQQAVNDGVCPQPTVEPVFTRAIAMDYTYQDMHDGGAPIVVRGIPIKLGEHRIDGSVFASALAALYQHDQELVPVDTAQANAQEDDARPVHIRETSADSLRDNDGPNGFTAVTEAWIDVHLEGETSHRRIPAAAVVTGDNAEAKKVVYVPGSIDRDAMSELLSRAFWTQEDFNNAADPGDALSDMEQEFLEEATAAMGDPAAALLMQMHRTVRKLRPTGPEPQQKLTVTSPDGHFRLTWLPQPAADDGPA